MTGKEQGAVPAYDAIEDMARAYMRSRIILTAVELDLFTRVGGDGRSVAEVAGELATNVRATEMLLNALVAIGLRIRFANGVWLELGASAQVMPDPRLLSLLAALP